MDAISNVTAAALDTCTAADVNRLLGLADQFLEDWAEDAVQSGKRDAEYEQISADFAAVRPLLLASPDLLKALLQINALCDGSDEATFVRCREVAGNALRFRTAKTG